MVNEWSRADLPEVRTLWTKMQWRRWSPDLAASIVDAVVDHLNEHHPMLRPGLLSDAADCVLESAERVKSAERDRDRLRRAHEIVEGERDLARDRWREAERERDDARERAAHRERLANFAGHALDESRDERDEALEQVRKLGEGMTRAQNQREELRRERDSWKARAEAHAKGATRSNVDRDKAYSELTAVTNRLAAAERERDEWKARAEETRTVTRDQLWRVLAAHDPGDDELGVSRVGTVTDAVWALLHRGQDVPSVERQPSVTRDEIEKALTEHSRMAFGVPMVSVEEAAETVIVLVSGDDPAVFVVRESGLPEAERDGEMFAAGGWGYTPTARASLDEEIECKTEALTSLLAIRRAIDTGQAVDPVEAKAVELCAVAHPEHEWGNAPWDVAEHYEGVEAAFRRLAAHLLGQEASDA